MQAPPRAHTDLDFIVAQAVHSLTEAPIRTVPSSPQRGAACFTNNCDPANTKTVWNRCRDLVSTSSDVSKGAVNAAWAHNQANVQNGAGTGSTCFDSSGRRPHACAPRPPPLLCPLSQLRFLPNVAKLQQSPHRLRVYFSFPSTAVF